jgi:thiamine biosynthesis lipoprotein
VMGARGPRAWTVAIRDPRREGEVVAVLPLQDVAISTSGDYERFFERDGVRCHHLLDPRTGKSPDAVRSVTVIADDGLTTEALSKTVFVLGVEQGLRFIEAQPGVDAVIVDAQGALHYSAGLT